MYFLHRIHSDSEKIPKSHYFDAKDYIALFSFYIIVFLQFLLVWRGCYDLSHKYTALFMTCSEIEDTGLRIAARTALLDDALRVAEEEVVVSLENIMEN